MSGENELNYERQFGSQADKIIEAMKARGYELLTSNGVGHQNYPCRRADVPAGATNAYVGLEDPSARVRIMRDLAEGFNFDDYLPSDIKE